MRSGLMKTALGMMLLLYTLVRSLETGYKYTTEDPIENDVLNKDLKCGYLFGAYSHMRVIKLFLDEPYSTDIKWLNNSIAGINNIVRSQIVSLFDLNGVRIGAMWLVHLFTGLVIAFYQDSKNPMNDHPKILETLAYIIDKLNAELAGCREGNSFDWYDSVLKAHLSGTLGLYDYSKVILVQQLDDARAQLKSNDISSDSSLKEWLEISTKCQSLFLHNLGLHTKLKNDLQNVYNLKIEWNNTSMILFALWENARYLDWTDTNLYSIKLYYNTCYDYLKIILFGLTSKHMTYLLYYNYKSDSYLRYAQEWYNIVVEFGSMLNLSEDLHVISLLDTLGNLINGTWTIASVNKYLVAILVTLCQPFGCDASNSFAIDNREFPKHYTSLNAMEIKFLKITVSTVLIEYNSLENAKLFLSHLRLAFRKVNFRTIRLLTEYIDELNSTNGVVRSEECTEELENLHLNISDYD